MPVGPHGEKRPVSIVANAKRIVEIAASLAEEEYITPEHKKRHLALKRSLKNATEPKKGKKAKSKASKKEKSKKRSRTSERLVNVDVA